MWKLVPVLTREMGQAYPELIRAEALITETLKLEETRFRATLARGLSILDEKSAGLKKGAMFDGETAFTLYDTYGFPLDLTQDALRAARHQRRSRLLRRRHAAPARKGARLLGGLRRGRDRDRVVCPAREGRRHRVPRLRDRKRRGRRRRAGQGRQGSQRAEKRRERRGGDEPDAVLRRVRRPGRRYRRDAARGRARHRHRHAEEGRRRLRASGQGRGGHASRSATRCCWRSTTRAARPSAPTIRRRICCTRRCARCSAITWRRRARWSRPTGCASTSRIPSR